MTGTLTARGFGETTKQALQQARDEAKRLTDGDPDWIEENEDYVLTLQPGGNPLMCTLTLTRIRTVQ